MKKIVQSTRTAALTAALLLGAAAVHAATIDGEVKKIDESASKITLKHGPAKSLGMDQPMTMVYRVKDTAMLKQVHVGDKVEFDAEEFGRLLHRDQSPKETITERRGGGLSAAAVAWRKECS